MLTGREPREGDLPTAADHPHSLFTLLARSHRLSVVEPITDVCPTRPVRRGPAGHGRPPDASLGHGPARRLRCTCCCPTTCATGLPPIDRDWQGFENEAIGPTGHARAAAGPSSRRSFERLGDDDPPARLRARSIDAVGEPGAAPAAAVPAHELPHVPWRFLPDGQALRDRRRRCPA